jgi:hypothetical protein
MTYTDWTNALVVDSAASEHGIENAGELAATVPNQQPKLSWQQRLSGHARVATGPEAGSKAKLNTVLPPFDRAGLHPWCEEITTSVGLLGTVQLV